MTDEKEKKTPRKKHRSPNYPYVNLETAIAKTDDLWKVGKTHFVAFNAVMDAWDYKAASANSVTAALRAYGLIETTGSGKKRELRVSEAGRKILEEHSTITDLLKEAALSPTLNRELWDKYEGDLPPSDKVITEYLKDERHFNPDSVDGYVSDFRETIAFAKLSKTDTIDSRNGGDSESSDNDNEDSNGSGSTGSENSGGTSNPPPKLGEGVMYTINIDVLNDGQINVVTTGDLNRKTMALLQQVFTLKEEHEIKPVKESEQEAVPGSNNQNENLK